MTKKLFINNFINLLCVNAFNLVKSSSLSESMPVEHYLTLLKYLLFRVRLQLIIQDMLGFNTSGNCCFRIFFTLLRNKATEGGVCDSKGGRWKVDGHQDNIAGHCQNPWHEWNKWMTENENGWGVSSGRQNKTSANCYEWGNCCWANVKKQTNFVLFFPSHNLRIIRQRLAYRVVVRKNHMCKGRQWHTEDKQRKFNGPNYLIISYVYV